MVSIEEWLQALKDSWNNDFMPDFLRIAKTTLLIVAGLILLIVVIWLVRLFRGSFSSKGKDPGKNK
jgi:hypothetical protein